MNRLPLETNIDIRYSHPVQTPARPLVRPPGRPLVPPPVCPTPANDVGTEGAVGVVDIVEPSRTKAYRAAVAALSSKIAEESELGVPPGAQSRLHTRERPSDRGVAILLHGFSSGTWQYDIVAKKLYDRGYDVYVPRLPGHGYTGADGTPDSGQIPNSRDHYRWDEFAMQVADDAATLGDRRFVVGLSGGGAAGTRMLQLAPGIERAVMMAPFYRPKDTTAQTIITATDWLDYPLFGLPGRVLDALDHDFGASEHDNPHHRHATKGQIYGLSAMGSRAIGDASAIETPIQFITTTDDWAIDHEAVRTVYDASGGDTRNRWFHFGAEDAVPHAMFHPDDNRDPRTRTQIEDMILHWLEGGDGHSSRER